ncbi:CpsD/CapB family tyrosine-protein kinase [Pseudodonghicola flavimaris]|uniref:CpsD/CapB family tyrosine-protein kinase n=1 Tax=Pseudodonghicola flavimaris TaxID=3050036 RepID=A0ABT7F3I7_9RHOB|nr:CpsD/CapB family tyrosine-protein kinase [Pseudodonghicola flavimaris]MDK3019180.1 CpsD/CapB family tyrosine-protein kinase [Pseudodonghicola flavimaris]
MKDYLESDLVSAEGEILMSAPWNAVEADDAKPMNRQDRRIFRRKAARQQAEQEGLRFDREPARNLPAPLPEPWERLHRVKPGAKGLGAKRAPLVNLFRDTPAARSFDLLRTRLMQTLRTQGWRRIAVVAPTEGCGATFTAVNLALSLARVPGSRTVLMDLNRRTPGVAAALDIHGHGRMDAFLGGALSPIEHLVRCSDGLALGLADAADPNAAESFHDPLTVRALDDMVLTLDPDVVIYDLPPVLSHDDAAAILPHVDGVLLVADGTRTTADQIRACEDILGEQTELLGVILNRARTAG